MENQIEEMAKILNHCCNEYDENGRHIRNKCNSYDCEYWSEDNFCCCSYNRKEAEALYNAGYRKASDVAREIFAEIEKVIGDKYEGYVFDNINIEGVEQDAIIAFVDAMSNHFAELKKKYESEDGE